MKKMTDVFQKDFLKQLGEETFRYFEGYEMIKVSKNQKIIFDVVGDKIFYNDLFVNLSDEEKCLILFNLKLNRNEVVGNYDVDFVVSAASLNIK